MDLGKQDSDTFGYGFDRQEEFTDMCKNTKGVILHDPCGRDTGENLYFGGTGDQA